MIRSIQSQVIALVAVSVLVAHVISISLFFSMRDHHEGGGHFPDRAAMHLLATLYAESPNDRAALLRHAQEAGLTVQEIPDKLVRDCEPDDHPCVGDGTSPDMRLVRATKEMWLGAAFVRPPPPPVRMRNIAAVIAGIGLPALALSLWASRRVTAPLRRLTEQAELVDPEAATIPLRVEGTTEIRLLVEAFNRLIQRLTRYSMGQRRLLAAISHDLRTPLTRLRLRAETITDPATRQKMVHDVTTMQILIDSTLGLLAAQDGATNRTRVDLVALLQTVADEMTDSGTPVNIGDLVPLTLTCDPALLSRAVENLLENAAKYATGGTLTLAQRNGEAIIEIADTGPGLTDTEKSQVFEPWFRTDTARGGQGSGLGLAIVKAVMTALGGRVELHDAVPQGLVVQLVVPVT